MIESLFSGAIQGIFEWLPVSSQGVITVLFGSTAIRWALFLHLGTFLAALVFFRHQVFSLIKTLFFFKKADPVNQKILLFLLISSAVSGAIGLVVWSYLQKIVNYNLFNLVVGFFLLITALVLWRAKKGGLRQESELKITDGIVAGVAQGFSILPGLSRSGLTVSSLLMRRCNEETALRLSFLMSMPASLAASVILGWPEFSWVALAGLATAFIFGLLTIKLLLDLAKKINFSVFVLVFALLTIFSVFLPADDIVAVVNGEAILKSDYERIVDRVMIINREMQIKAEKEDVRETVLREMIEQELFRQEAVRLGIYKEAEIDAVCQPTLQMINDDLLKKQKMTVQDFCNENYLIHLIKEITGSRPYQEVLAELEEMAVVEKH